MRKLNNKGMTAVEVLVCFLIVVIITVSMYTMVSAYKNKQEIEAIKEKIVTYKNLLTKEINDDLIKNGIISAEVKEFTADSDNYEVTMTLRNGDKKRLKIRRVLAFDYLLEPDKEGSPDRSESKDDEFMISYGDYDSETDYPIPDVGYSENLYGNKIYDLRINNVDINTDDSILTIYIDFYHPELGTKYAIDIVCPMNFSFTSSSANDVTSVPTASLRINDSNGNAINNDGTWQNKTVWLGEFSAFSSVGIDYYEISEGCTGSYVEANLDGYTFVDSTDKVFCIRAVDNDGKTSASSEPYYVKVDKDAPNVSISKVNSVTPGTCYAKENNLGVKKDNCYLYPVTLRMTYNDSSSGIKNKNFSCLATAGGSSWSLDATINGDDISVNPNIPKDRTSVANVTCTLTATDLADNINSTTYNFIYGNGWEKLPGPDVHGYWRYIEKGAYLEGWQKLYYFNDKKPEGSVDWYYFYKGTETEAANYCIGVGNKYNVARGWCKEIGYPGFYYFSNPNDYVTWISGERVVYDGYMLYDATVTIKGETYKFDSSGRCIEGNGCY